MSILGKELPTIIGVDPGLSGAIAVLSPYHSKVKLFDMPVVWRRISNGRRKGKVKRRRSYDVQKVIDILRSEYTGGPVLVVIERQAAYRGTSAARLGGLCEGMFCGISKTLGYDVLKVRPQQWKQYFDLIKKEKSASRTKAKKLYPEADLKTKKTEDQAEALLVATYGHDWVVKIVAWGDRWQDSEELS